MKKRLLTAIAAGAAATLALAGCSSNSGSESAGDTGNDKKDLTIAVFSGWAEDIAASYLWQQVLEDQGYNVTLESATAGPVYAGLSEGSYDVTFDAALPDTHRNYWDKYGDKLEDIGTWYEDSILAIAVNKDAPIDSLDQLAANADKFDNRIVGIEPGAGETGVVKDSLIPAYGLEKMDFITSSTPAMLAALKKAIKNGDNIAVTLWTPHWAYDAFPLKNLKDPKGAMGDPGRIDIAGRDGFAKDYPQLTSWLKDFEMSDELLTGLEHKLFPDADESEYPGIVKKWMSKHKDFVDDLTS